MTHRMAVEEFLYRKNLVPARPSGPRLSQEELDRQVHQFLSAGGAIERVPAGKSGEVIEHKPKVRREDKRVKRRLRDDIDLENSVGTDYVAKLLGCSITGVRDIMREEEVPHFRYGRTLKFRKDEIEAWAAGRKAIKAG